MKKQMLAFIQRTKSISSSPEPDFKYAKLVLKNSLPKRSKDYSNTVSFINSKNSSNRSSNRSSRYNSPNKSSRHNSSNKSSRYNSPNRFSASLYNSNGFISLGIKSLDQLLAVRSNKIDKNLKIVSEEIKILKNIKFLVEKEFKNRKRPKSFSKLDEKINEITKESAEDLIVLENKCKEISEQNKAIIKELNQTNQIDNKNEKLMNAQDYIQKTAINYQDQELSLQEPHIIPNYLETLQEIATDIFDGLKTSDFPKISSYLSQKILEEYKKSTISSDEVTKILKYQQNIRQNLENKLKSLPKSPI